MTNTMTAVSGGVLETVGARLTDDLVEKGTVFLLLFSGILVLAGIIVYFVRREARKEVEHKQDLANDAVALKEANEALIAELKAQMNTRDAIFQDFRNLTAAIVGSTKMIEEINRGYQEALRFWASRGEK